MTHMTIQINELGETVDNLWRLRLEAVKKEKLPIYFSF